MSSAAGPLLVQALARELERERWCLHRDGGKRGGNEQDPARVALRTRTGRRCLRQSQLIEIIATVVQGTKAQSSRAPDRRWRR